jgi:hypothetical protein
MTVTLAWCVRRSRCLRSRDPFSWWLVPRQLLGSFFSASSAAPSFVEDSSAGGCEAAVWARGGGASAAETAVMTKARTISRFTLPSPGRRDSRASGPGGQAYIHDKDRQVSRGYLAIWGSVMGRGVYRLGGDRLTGLADQDRPVADVAVEAPPRLVDVVPAGAVWTECGPGGFPAKE